MERGCVEKNTKILIVEDEILLQLTLAMMLEKMGFTHITKVPSGEEAVELARQEKYDLILMDIMLKDRIDGIDAYQQIKELCGAIPIIYITGNADPMSKEKASRFGYHDYLIKPLAFEQLEKSIQSLCASVKQGG
ncbi:MAG TPA: response regulator [Balneolaceae bacterium]|nr:response regulator [Balneolaceae bacterium]